jgi:regulator of nonsense transcripts 2
LAGVVGGQSDDSDDDDEDGDRPDEEDEEDEDNEAGDNDSAVCSSPPILVTAPLTDAMPQLNDRPGSPEDEDVIVASNSAQEYLGPTEEAEADFMKELAKMVTDTSAESRKVDKKTALALWDSAVIPPTGRKKRVGEEGGGPADEGVTNFVVLTKRGNKQMTRQIAVPSASTLAIQTRTAQLQDKVEQQQLKQLVLNYEQREELEELKGTPMDPPSEPRLLTISPALEAKHRNGGIKIRLVG